MIVTVALDTDYVSEAYTCSSNNETLLEPGEDQDDGHRRWKATRWEKAGLGATAKMVLGLMWRNADVSTSQETNMFDNTHLIFSVHCLHPLAHIQVLQRKGIRKRI